MAQLAYAKFDFFFDRAKVQRVMDRKTQRVLALTGRHAQQRMKSRMRPAIKESTYLKRLEKAKRKARDAQGRFTMREKVYRGSKPGEPPRTHTKLLRDRIFFFADLDSKAVVIGPEKLSTGRATVYNPEPVPATLEYGGTIVVPKGRGSRGSFQARIEPRPYVAPTFPLAQAKFKELLEKEPFK